MSLAMLAVHQTQTPDSLLAWCSLSMLQLSILLASQVTTAGHVLSQEGCGLTLSCNAGQGC